MPYKSQQQRKFFHSAGAKKAGITQDEVKEFDTASKGKALPERVKAPRKRGTKAKAVMQAVAKKTQPKGD